MGAYDFAWPVASKGLIPGFSLRYGGIDTASVSWIDSVTPYLEASTILKPGTEYNPSTMLILGASWTLVSNLYLYSDVALSNGNYFVGNDGDAYSSINTVGDFGVNGNDKWNVRVNLNFGYYF